MQRHAVHGRRHAVLAHAVMDEAAGEVGGADRRHRLGAGVVRAGQVGRAADHLRHRRGSGSPAHIRTPRASRYPSAPWRASLSRRARRRPVSARAGPRASGARTRCACRQAPRRAACPIPCARSSSAGRRRATASRTSVGIWNGASLQPSFSRAPLISSAPSGEPCELDLPALVGAPKPIVVLQAIIDGLSEVLAFSIAAAIASGSWPSIARRGPAGGLEALHLVDRVGERQRPVDRDAVVVEQHDQLGELEMAGERDGFLADAFHQVAVGGEHEGRVIDDVLAELGGEVALGDRHADRVGDALAERAGGRLDAGRDEIFRMPGRQRADLAEALELVERHRLVAERDAAARRSASSRGRRTARSGRGRARPDRPDRISGTA